MSDFVPRYFVVEFVDGNSTGKLSRFLIPTSMNNKRKSETAGRQVGVNSFKQLSLTVQSGVIEVRGHGGLFQQGKMVNCTDEGLMIDWECHGEPTPQLVPFGKIYCCKPEDFREKNAISQGKTSVEVLVRGDPKAPRTWYPGKLLYGNFGCQASFGLVDVALPDGAVGAYALIVPADRIRRPQTDALLEKLRLRQGQLVKHSVPLLGRITRDAAVQQVLDAWMSRCRFAAKFFRAIGMNNETLDFITIATDFVPVNEQLFASFGMRGLDTILTSTYTTERRQKRKLAETDLESSADDTDNDASYISSTNITITMLPAEILASTFGYLDSMEQHRLRRVCVYWDRVLTSPSVARVLRVHYENKTQDYLSAASLHHCWTLRTKIILNAGVLASRSPLFCGGQLLRTLVKQGLHSNVQRLVVANVVFSVEAGGHHANASSFIGTLSRLVEEVNEMAAVCQCLSLHNVKVNLGRDVWPLKSASVRILTGQISGCLTVTELWARMDDSLAILDPVQMVEMSDWVGLLDADD